MEASGAKLNVQGDRVSRIAWRLFDRIVLEAESAPVTQNPWSLCGGAIRYAIDEATLVRLLGVPLAIKGVKSQSGVLATALDVWVAYELRRAGFSPNAVWPRAEIPRVLSVPVGRLLEGSGLTKEIAQTLRGRIEGKSSVPGVSSAHARVLGKLYEKQIDAGMSRWETGPEVLISTKRMDGAFGKNLANRAEESYGDAKNLRLRYPLAAIGFIFGLRSTVLTERRSGARAVIDRLEKLEREDDAYDATCLVMLEYDDPTSWREVPKLSDLPTVAIRWDAIPATLRPDAFFEKIIGKVLSVTPEDYHQVARRMIETADPVLGLPSQ